MASRRSRRRGRGSDADEDDAEDAASSTASSSRAGKSEEVLRLNSSDSTTFTFRFHDSELVFRQDPTSFNHGLAVWDAGLVLASFLDRTQGRRLRGKRVLEIGSGCGVLGVALARLGAHVTLSDLPSVTPLLRDNVARNTRDGIAADAEVPAPDVVEFDFTAPIPDALRRPFDLIVGTDVIYSEALVRPLLTSIHALACEWGGGRATAILANEIRCEVVHGVFRATAADLFVVKQVPRRKLEEGFVVPNIAVFELRPRSAPRAHDPAADEAGGGGGSGGSPEVREAAGGVAARVDAESEGSGE